MTRQKKNKPYRTLTTMTFAVIAGITFLVGVGLLYISGGNITLWTPPLTVRILLENLGGLLIVSAGLGTLWELVGKRAFAREVLESARIPVEIQAAGIKSIGSNYLTDTGWPELFKGAEKLDVFVAYGQTWRNTHLNHLHELARNRNARLRIYLADPEDDSTMNILSQRFQMPVEELIRNVNKTKEDFQALQVPGGADIEVFYYAGDRVFSFYRFDSKAVLTFYRHSEGRTVRIPTIVCQAGGSLYEFLRTELEYIRTKSRPT